ncbi:MAG TPA: OmpA family protein [Parapedobacter sp.]|uniref:OmpA family protein n=1 Tax=Parapedobacter sp. TaxID=1958893 RepID=UPI002BA50EB2|nr:OmpA family protein [Parapedobacter sp.]HWK57225.1 OmpA family protein [Parapedobacter sp.]
MSKLHIYLLLIPMILLSACSSGSRNEQAATDDTAATEDTAGSAAQTPAGETETQPGSDEDFDIQSIVVSTADIGDFPFFTAPEGSLYINRAKPLDFDFMVFVTPGSIYEVEGKTFRAHVHPDRKSDKQISGRYLIKSYEDAIMQAGGVKVFEGKLTGDRRDKYAELCTYAGSNGSIDIWNHEIATYVIRRDDGNIYIALDKGNTNTTSIQIVQEAPFEQTIQRVTADAIAADLTEKGKSILYINFDVDKSTITTEGKAVVDQIAEALQKNAALRISIEGHTDNTGSAAHNKTLSNDRAVAVMDALVGKGIEKSRLAAKGLGADAPLVANDSEENKAKNRRVELVRMD